MVTKKVRKVSSKVRGQEGVRLDDQAEIKFSWHQNDKSKLKSTLLNLAGAGLDFKGRGQEQSLL